MEKKETIVKAEEIVDVDGIDFRTTKEGKKLLMTLIVKSNELNHLEKKEEEIESETWIEDKDNFMVLDDRIITALDIMCGIHDVKCLYIRREGNHLAVGKAEVNCLM